jgi:hypothetical protein
VLHAELARGLRLGHTDTRFYDVLDGPLGRLRDRRFADSSSNACTYSRTDACANACANTGTYIGTDRHPDSGPYAGSHAAAYSRSERFAYAISVSFSRTHSHYREQLF